MNILDLIPRAKPIKERMPICEVCGDKCFLIEGKIITCPADGELMFVCNPCLLSVKYPAWLHLKLNGEI